MPLIDDNSSEFEISETEDITEFLSKDTKLFQKDLKIIRSLSLQFESLKINDIVIHRNFSFP